MKTTLLAAATALAMTGSAFAYQTYDATPDPAVTATISVDPTVAITPPTAWTPEQRMLWEQHMAFYPETWTAQQRAAFLAAMEMPPANWTLEQRTLYEQHLAHLPTTWTAAGSPCPLLRLMAKPMRRSAGFSCLSVSEMRS